MKTSAKLKIIGGILLGIGVVRLISAFQSNNTLSLIAGDLLFIIAGAVLLIIGILKSKTDSGKLVNSSTQPTISPQAEQTPPSPQSAPILQTTPESKKGTSIDKTSNYIEPDYKNLNADEVIEKYISTDHTDYPERFRFSHYKIAEFKCILTNLKRAKVLADLSKDRKKRVATEFSYYSTVKFNKNTDYSTLGDFIVIDTETTGLNPKNDRIIELSAVKFHKFRPVEVFSTYIDPRKHIPNVVTDITGIDDDLIQGSPIYAQIQESFEDYIKDYNLVFHNARFDLAFLHYSGTSIDTDNQHVFDTLELAKKHLKDEEGNKYSSYKLDIACAYRNINIANAHSSEADALATGLLFNEIVKEASGKINLNELIRQ